MRHVIKKLFLYLLPLVLIPASNAVTVVGWDVSGISESAVTLTADTFATGISSVAPSGVLSRGAGASLPGSPAGTSYGASGFDSTTLTLAISNSDYFTFTTTPSAGFQMTLTNVTYKLFVTTTGATNGALLSSVGGFSAANAISSFAVTGNANNDNDIALSAGFTNLTSAVEFRLYFWGGASTTTDKVRFRNLAGDDLIVAGTVTAVPEPSTWLAFLSGGALLVVWNRRRSRLAA